MDGISARNQAVALELSTLFFIICHIGNRNNCISVIRGIFLDGGRKIDLVNFIEFL